MSKDRVTSEIVRYINSGFSSIYLYTYEEQKSIEIIKEIAEQLGRDKVYTYDIAKGLACVSGQDKKLAYDPRQNIKNALIYLRDNIKEPSFIVFKDCHQYLTENPETVRDLKNIINLIKQGDLPINIFLLSSKLNLPMEIEKEVIVIDIPLPNVREIEEILIQYAERYDLSLSKTLRDRFTDALNGLTENEIKGIVSYCLADDGVLDYSDIEEIVRFKKQIIKKGGLLELVEVKERPDDIGGLNNLKKWLNTKRSIFESLESARWLGVDVPKGFLMVGMPGCGKSLTARVTASLFGMPLLRLDMGVVMGPYLGQSEENIRKVIKLSEAIAPSILWIDEIEKGLAGAGSSGSSSSEVTTRIFGTILTWMQEKTAPVFIIATSNDISFFPPEFLRKGRFDEIFFVNFPKATAIEEIMKIHFRKRGWLEITKDLSFKDISTEMEKREFAGSDVEAVVKETIETLYVGKLKTISQKYEKAIEEADTEDKKKSIRYEILKDVKDHIHEEINNVIRGFKPLGETMKNKIKIMRDKIKELKLTEAD